MGPIVHVHERLANRTRDYPVGIDRAAFRRRLDPGRGEQLKTSPAACIASSTPSRVSADLTTAQLRRCRRALRRFWVKRGRRASARYASLTSDSARIERRR